MIRRFAYKAKGIGLTELQQAIAATLKLGPKELVGASKIRKMAEARILTSYFAVTELGLSMTEIAKQLQVSLPTISVAVQKGEQIAKEEGLKIEELLNVNI